MAKFMARMVSWRHGHTRMMATKVGIVGVPFGKGQSYGGPNKTEGLEAAPDAIRKKIVKSIKAMGIDLKDYGQVSYSPLGDNTATVESLKNFSHVIANMKATSNAVSQVVNDGRTCIVLGGDHSIFTGSVHGHMQEKGEDNIAVIYIDAHADLNRSETSPTGHVHGMCVSAAAKEHHKQWMNIPHMEWIKHRFPLRNLAYIGLRAIDPEEWSAIVDDSVAAYTMTEVQEMGVGEVFKQVIRRIDPTGRKPIHLSLDIDSLDPTEAPSTTVPERGGLTLRELLYLIGKIRDTGRLSVMDLVEVNPLVGSEEDQKRTLHAAKLAILTALGRVLVPGMP